MTERKFLYTKILIYAVNVALENIGCKYKKA